MSLRVWKQRCSSKKPNMRKLKSTLITWRWRIKRWKATRSISLQVERAENLSDDSPKNLLSSSQPRPSSNKTPVMQSAPNLTTPISTAMTLWTFPVSPLSTLSTGLVARLTSEGAKVPRSESQASKIKVAMLPVSLGSLWCHTFLWKCEQARSNATSGTWKK